MHTKLNRSLTNICPGQRNGVVTIGNFDGVHLGHQQLISHAIAEAKDRGVAVTVITFEPHPFELFAGDKLQIPRITRMREKFAALRRLGVDYVLVLPFNHELARLCAADFVTLLVDQLKPQHMVVGDDFHFGKGRAGNIELLKAMGRELGFTAKAIDTYIVEGERVSSTRIRKALLEGKQTLAARLLGKPYTMMGRVCSGDQLGRKLGFPTANIFVHRRLTAVHGIYIVRMRGLDDTILPGVANVGVRPTVNGTRILLEVHLLNFNQDIYHRYVEVEFIKKVRDEERYDTLDELKDKIADDVAVAEKYFEEQELHERTA